MPAVLLDLPAISTFAPIHTKMVKPASKRVSSRVWAIELFFAVEHPHRSQSLALHEPKERVPVYQGKEIKGLISTSVERVEQGSELVDQAGITMTEVVGSIKRVTDIMGEISSASLEQSTGVSQMGEAISQMDQATQQNAALVEECAAAAESMKVQAQQLVRAVAVFHD
jgi:hypothetical protein